MPKYCCVYGCYSSSDKNTELSFHDFPTNSAQALAWKVRLRREDYEPTRHSYVCSRHFQEDDFSLPSKDTPLTFQKNRLKKGVLPSLFLRGEANVRERRDKRRHPKEIVKC